MKVNCIISFLLVHLLFCCEKPQNENVVPPPPPDPGTEVVDPEVDPEPDQPWETRQDYIIVGYATYWDSTMPDPSLLTHINYAFAHINKDFETLDIKNKDRLAKIAGLKKSHPGLKVLLSVGGWEAGNFSEMAADATHRKNFSNNCLAAVKEYDLDGIDIDWEYPTSSAAGISSSPNDTKNFNLLMSDLRNALGSKKLLTMASSANAQYVNFKVATQYLDYVNIMTYDMGKPPYHNAGLYKSGMTKRSCDESVDLHYQAGVPYEKIVLGIPFYGHGNGVEFSTDCVDFNEIKYAGFTKRWDDVAQVPYLVNSAGTMVLSYDDAASVGLKADYVKKKGLLGAMYWNIEADDSDWTLSKAIAERLLSDSGNQEETTVYQVTNPYMQAFVEEVKYPDRDYSYTRITDYPGGGPGEADIPPSVLLKWTPSASGPVKLKVWESGWSRDYSLPAGTMEQEIVNLVPGVYYDYMVISTNDSNVIEQGRFKTSGSVHQLYFKPKVRNIRDLGGWKTLDGKTVAFRKLYRGGRVDGKYINDDGKTEFRAAGIKAELDLREAEDVPSASPIGSDIAFCAPGFPGGYRGMLRDYKPGIKQCFEFVTDCLRKDKPVFFHCAAGRDRTGTLAIVMLGLLGVSEGDISKDYELTYFAPADWSMWTSKDPDHYLHTRTQSGSFVAACQFLWDQGESGSFAQHIESYLLSIGVKQTDIDDFRNLMLKD